MGSPYLVVLIVGARIIRSDTQFLASASRFTIMSTSVYRDHSQSQALIIKLGRDSLGLLGSIRRGLLHSGPSFVIEA